MNQQKKDVEVRKAQFVHFFSKLPFEQIKELAVSKSLRSLSIRSIAWKVFLGLLDGPTSLWEQQLKEQRIHFQKLVQEYDTDPTSKADHKDDPTWNNPLSQDSASPWAKHFQQNELKKIICQDLERTYPDKPFFREEKVFKMMLRILFVYSSKNSYLSYKQGMHELLAPIVHVLWHEALNFDAYLENPSQPSHPLSTQTNSGEEGETEKGDEEGDGIQVDCERMIYLLNDVNHLEADCYLLFERLMFITSPWFGTDAKTDENAALSPLLRKCRHLQNVLLREKDPALYDHLTSLQIEPQIYALRWFRLLFGREFHLEDLICLWDALFAYGNDLALVDYVAVAMLIFIRSNILGSDYSSCMKRLFKYPPVEDVHLFVEKALKLKKPPTKPVVRQPIQLPASRPQSQDEKGILSGIKHMIEPVNPATRRIKYLETEVLKHRQLQAFSAQKIEKIISILVKNLPSAPRTGDAEEPATETLEKEIDEIHIAIAELKQIKDTLSGLIPFDSSSASTSPSSSTSSLPTLSSSSSTGFSSPSVMSSTISNQQEHPLSAPSSVGQSPSPSPSPPVVQEPQGHRDPLLGLAL